MKCIFFFLKRTISTLQLKRIISDTLCLTGAGVSVGASGFCCELHLLPNKKQKLEEAWVLFPPFTAMLVMFDYKKVPNLGPGHCLDTKGFACISFSDLHFLIKFVLLSSEVPGKALRDALKEGVLPLDRILLESNAPYMTPNASDKELDDVCKSLLKRCKRGRNEPCTLPIVAHIVAKCLGVDAEEVARASAENTRRVFDLMASQSASQDNKDLNK